MAGVYFEADASFIYNYIMLHSVQRYFLFYGTITNQAEKHVQQKRQSITAVIHAKSI